MKVDGTRDSNVPVANDQPRCSGRIASRNTSRRRSAPFGDSQRLSAPKIGGGLSRRRRAIEVIRYRVIANLPIPSKAMSCRSAGAALARRASSSPWSGPDKSSRAAFGPSDGPPIDPVGTMRRKPPRPETSRFTNLRDSAKSPLKLYFGHVNRRWLVNHGGRKNETAADRSGDSRETIGPTIGWGLPFNNCAGRQN